MFTAPTDGTVCSSPSWDMALTFRKIARAGGDPLAERRKQRRRLGFGPEIIPSTAFRKACRSKSMVMNIMRRCDFADVPDFIVKLRASDVTETTRLAFEFLILTATRTSEVLGAKWDEIDIGSKTWRFLPVT
jgi:integrase